MEYSVKVYNGVGKQGWLNKNRSLTKPQVFQSKRAAVFAIACYKARHADCLCILRKHVPGVTS